MAENYGFSPEEITGMSFYQIWNYLQPSDKDEKPRGVPIYSSSQIEGLARRAREKKSKGIT
jgi:hypothetical protein